MFGAKAFAWKTFTDLPPYFKIRVFMRLIRIDIWTDKTIQIFLNSELKFSNALSKINNYYVGSQCGNSEMEEPLAISFEAEMEYSPSITVNITSNLDKDATQASWGFSDFKLSFLKCDVTCKTCTDELPTSCVSCFQHAVKQANGTCACELGYYAVIPSDKCSTSICIVCMPCYQFCSRCISDKATECRACFEG